MTSRSKSEQLPRRSRQPGWDAFLLAGLVFSLLQVVSFGEATLPTLVQDVLRHPILGNILPPAGEEAMGAPSPRPGDPIGLVLIAVTLGLLGVYFVVDLALHGPWRRVKWVLLAGIVLTAVFLPAGKLILLRQGSGPASYTHDGGVIQTEATIQFLLQGKNPYVEDYVNTPMAEWGFNEFRTALYHYPYLPWTFLFSTPFYILGQALGFYDQRLVYLLLMAIALALAPRLVRGESAQLGLVAALALNPMMGIDLVFGQNDSFVLCWVIFSLVAWHIWHSARQNGQLGNWHLWASAAFFGLACASKPTAWFFAPFYGLLLLSDQPVRLGWRGLLAAIPTILRRAWPALAMFALILLPYALWDADALYDDVWRWSNGQGETGYQIWGWGASNFVLAFGWAPDRFVYWPFWQLELLLAMPLWLWFLHRQQRANTLANACWHTGIFLLIFFYSSRFLNENYLGFILAFLAIGAITQYGAACEATEQSAENHPPVARA